MLFSQLYEKLIKIVPPENGLRDDLYGMQFGSILNSGDFDLSRVILCVDPTKHVISEAIKQKISLIISHHGLTHQSFLNINDLMLDQVKLLAINNIRLFIMHTALDAAMEGISESYAKFAGINVENNFYFRDKGEKKPIGRIGTPFRANLTLKDIAESLKRNLQLPYVRIVGNPGNIVKKAAVVGGKGFKTELITDILNAGCDTFITGEVTHVDMLAAKALGLNIIESTHYSSEKIGVMRLQQILALTFPRDEFIFVESGEPMIFI